MSIAKYIYIFFFISHSLCKFCSNRSSNKNFPKNWVGPLNLFNKTYDIYAMNLENHIKSHPTNGEKTITPKNQSRHIK